MFKNKKGSMEMSINSIVILVMAMALLGLGLVFIRGMMGGATAKLGKSIDTADLSEQPTSEKTVTIDPTVLLKKNVNSRVKIGFYNKANSDYMVKPSIYSCINSDGVSKTTQFTVQAISQVAEVGKAIGFEAMFKTTADQGTYACQVQIVNGTTSLGSQQFFIEVSS